MTEVTLQTPESGPTAPVVTQTTTAADRPAWLPDNFGTAEDFAASYKELQAKHTQTAQELAALKKPATTPAEPTSPAPAEGDKQTTEVTPDQAQQAAQAIDFAPFTGEFNTTGDVSEESRTKIAEGLKGIFGDDARGIVDAYVENSKLAVQRDTTELLTVVGGEEAYGEMCSWAGQHWDDAKIAAFDKAVEGSDKAAAKLAMTAMKAEFEQAHGKTPALITATSGATAGQAGYKSTAEMTAAINDPRYQKDPAYRDSVKARIAASTLGRQ